MSVTREDAGTAAGPRCSVLARESGEPLAATAPVALPEGFAQRCSEAQGRAIGARNVARLAERLGGGIVGAKLAATNPAALQKLGLAKPISAPLLGARVFASPRVLPRADFIVCVVEPPCAPTARAPRATRSRPRSTRCSR